MSNVELNVHDSYMQNLELFFALAYLSDVSDTLSGNDSEDNGVYVSTASDDGQNYVVIPTDLLLGATSRGRLCLNYDGCRRHCDRHLLF